MPLQEYQLLYLDNDIPINRSFYCNNGDIKSRGLEVHVLDNSQAKDCTGLTLKMIIKVPSGELFETTVANGLVTVLNAATGIYQILFPDNMGRGRLIAEIQLSNAVPEVIVSRKFSIIGDGSLTSDGSISALPQGGLLWNVLTNETQRQADFDAILGSLDAEVATKYAELEAEYATDLTDVKSQLAERATQSALEVEKARINSFTTLAEGSTTGDAELIDGRVSTNGITYANIGGAVRSKLDDIKALFARVADKKQINGATRTLDNSTTALTNTMVMYAKHDIKVSVNSGYRYLIFLWKDGTGYNLTNFISSSGWKIDTQTILKGSYYAIQFGKADASAISLTDIANLNMEDVVFYEKLAEVKADILNIQTSLVKETLYHILGTGQSLSVGAQGNPSLSTLCPLEMVGKTFIFNGGARPIDGEDFTVGETGYIKDDRLAYLISAHEQDNTLHIDDTSDGVADRDSIQGETISSALAYSFTKLTGKKCLVSQHGFGGKSYNDLKKGTMSYANLIRAVYNAKSIAGRMGMNYEVMGVTVVHGENDSTSGVTEAQYIAYLNEWQSNLDTDIKAITGQTRAVKLYVSQTASASSYSLATSPIPNAVFKASVQNANIRLVCAQYWFTYASVHMDNYGYRKLGEYFGNQIGRDFIGNPKSCVYPTKSVTSGNIIILTINSIVPLATDVGNVPQRSDGHYGFTINDSNGSVITGVSVSGTTVTITLDKAPAVDAQIEYAYRPLADELGKIGATGVRGNIRDTGGLDSYFDTSARPNWLCIFSISVNYN